MRWLLVMFLSESRGTLKSTWCVAVRFVFVLHTKVLNILTRMRTRLPLRSTSAIDSLLERDMVGVQ